MSTQEKIEELTRRIASRFKPEQIILFGSHGRGDAGAESDVDLLVVMNVDKTKRQAAVEIGVAVHDIDLPKDIIVTTPQEYEWRKDVTGTIEYPAAHEGKVLYARA